MVRATRVITALKATSSQERLWKLGVYSGKENTSWGGMKAVLKLLKDYV